MKEREKDRKSRKKHFDQRKASPVDLANSEGDEQWTRWVARKVRVSSQRLQRTERIY